MAVDYWKAILVLFKSFRCTARPKVLKYRYILKFHLHSHNIYLST